MAATTSDGIIGRDRDRICGPVTAIDLENGMLAVMGTWIATNNNKSELDLEDIEVGQRVRVGLMVSDPDEDDPHLLACSLKNFEGHFDRVRGTVQEVVETEDDGVVQIRVLDTLIDVVETWCDED